MVVPPGGGQQPQQHIHDGSNLSTGSSDREPMEERTPERIPPANRNNNNSSATTPSASATTPTERKRRRKNNVTDDQSAPLGIHFAGFAVVDCIFYF